LIYAAFILTGLLSGVISGMGIGGGALLIPALTVCFGLDQRAAQSVSLVCFIPAASAALVSHIKNGNVEKRVLRIILFGLPGAAAGAALAMYMGSAPMRRLFGAFLLIMGIVEFLKKK